MKINSLKTILYFGLLSVCLEMVSKLVSSHFNLTQLFNFDFIVFDILLELVVNLSSAFLTNIFVLRFSNNKLGSSLISVTIFGFLYATFALIFIVVLTMFFGKESVGIPLGFYSTFINYLPHGLHQGIIFMFVFYHFIFRK